MRVAYRWEELELEGLPEGREASGKRERDKVFFWEPWSDKTNWRQGKKK